jgi:hypothetical protein
MPNSSAVCSMRLTRRKESGATLYGSAHHFRLVQIPGGAMAQSWMKRGHRA